MSIPIKETVLIIKSPNLANKPKLKTPFDLLNNKYNTLSYKFNWSLNPLDLSKTSNSLYFSNIKRK